MSVPRWPALSFICLLLTCCAHSEQAATVEPATQPDAKPALPPLPRKALNDYLPSVGISWLVSLNVRDLYTNQQLREDFQEVFQSGRIEQFQLASGLDPNRVERVWIAGYELGTLILVDARKVGAEMESAFRKRSLTLSERQTSRPELTYLTATMGGAPRAMVHFKDHFVAIAEDDLSLARLVVAYAEAEIEVPTALESAYLAPFWDQGSTDPVRIFLRGPFPSVTDPVAAGFVAGTVSFSLEGANLNGHAAVLGAWPLDELLASSLELWLRDLLSTREFHAMGWGSPTLFPVPTCQPQLISNHELVYCEAGGTWISRDVARAVYRLTAAPMEEITQ